MKIAEGIKDDGIEVGNTYNKYSSRNPLARLLLNGFTRSLNELVKIADPHTIHEVGCGEGYWVLHWYSKGFNVYGTDFSSKIIDIAKHNAQTLNYPSSLFYARSIYSLEHGQDSADLIVCCEVLEHLENPELGLECLANITRNNLIISVPREPIWRILNILRGKYIRDLGNTPGHIQHWSKNKFIRLLRTYFYVAEIKTPLPWTMALCRISS